MSGSVWIVSYVMLWVAVAVLGFSVVVLLRQVGVLHARVRPSGVHPAGEGPARGVAAPPLPGIDYAAKSLTVVSFTSSTCAVCAELAPGIQAMQRQYSDIALHTFEFNDQNAPVFNSFAVRSTPYFVTVDQTGVVQLTGVANSLEQLEVMVDESRRINV